MMTSVAEKLAGGDRRSIGRVDEVVSDIGEDQALLPSLVDCLFIDDPVVRMRAADALEKATAAQPQNLQPFKSRLLELAARTRQQELRWHLAQMVPRMRLTPSEKDKFIAILFDYLLDKSKIVVTCSMQALVDFATTDTTLRPQVIRMLETKIKTGSPAMKSRGIKLLTKL